MKLKSLSEKLLPSLSLISAVLFVSSCSTPEMDVPEESGQKTEMSSQPAKTESSGHTNAVAGISWDVPATWTVAPEQQMRVATYFTPGAEDTRGECAVFFFGANQGGGIEANIARWAGQFQTDAGGTPEAKTTEKTIGDTKVTMVDIEGTYLRSIGRPMSGQTERLPGYRLFGAIVEAPGGLVFFKFSAPESTAQNEHANFDSMLASLR